MTDDEIVIRAVNAFQRYCKEHKCSGCAVGDFCWHVRKDGEMPQNIPRYDVGVQMQKIAEFRARRK